MYVGDVTCLKLSVPKTDCHHHRSPTAYGSPLCIYSPSSINALVDAFAESGLQMPALLFEELNTRLYPAGQALTTVSPL
jgi:hypothetical protein